MAPRGGFAVKITVCFGSARKSGHTAHALDNVMDGFLSIYPDADINILHLNDLNIHGCIGCNHCQGDHNKNYDGNDAGCAIKDDMTWIYDDLIESDLIIIASPIYMHNFTGQTKLFLDRTYSLHKYIIEPHDLMPGKPFAVVMTFTDDDAYTASHAILSLREILYDSGRAYKGEFFISGASAIEGEGGMEVVLSPDNVKRAHNFGVKLAKDL